MKRLIAVTATLAVAGSVASSLEAVDPWFQGASATSVQSREGEAKAKDFEPFSLSVPFGAGIGRSRVEVRCVTRAVGERPRGKVTLDPEFLDPTGGLLTNPPPSTKRLSKNGTAVITLQVPAASRRAFVLLVDGSYRGGRNKRFRSVETTCTARERLACSEDDETLCLRKGRFRTTARWRTGGGGGPARVAVSGSEVGTFYFSDSNRSDLIVQVLNRCGATGRFDVVVRPGSTAEWKLAVEDTETGATRFYSGSLGRRSPRIDDVGAFATCP